MKTRKILAALVGLVLLQGSVSTSYAATAQPTKHHKKVASKSSTAKTAPTTKRVRHKARPAATASRVSHHARALPAVDHRGMPVLGSAAFMLLDQSTGQTVLAKNAEETVPIASITKLMTAMVVLDAKQDMSEILSITDNDVDTLKGSSSRVPVGTELSRAEFMQLALMSSENRAASALAHNYPGGLAAAVAAMNRKARELGLTETHFDDPTGLHPSNVSSARDLARMVAAAARYPLIREYTTTAGRDVQLGRRTVHFNNTNALVKDDNWEIGVSKTGYIKEAGRCLVMQAWLKNKPMIIVLLDSQGKYTRTADAQRIKSWLETAGQERIAAATKASAS